MYIACPDILVVYNAVANSEGGGTLKTTSSPSDFSKLCQWSLYNSDFKMLTPEIEVALTRGHLLYRTATNIKLY